jgi:hypothetical protein
LVITDHTRRRLFDRKVLCASRRKAVWGCTDKRTLSFSVFLLKGITFKYSLGVDKVAV